MVFQHQLIESLSTHKNATAIEIGSSIITYADLLKASNKVTSYLLDFNLSAETIVGIMVDDRSDIIISMIGVMNARCTFVLLDSSWPESRLNILMKELNLGYLITSKKNQGVLYATNLRKSNVAFVEDIFNMPERPELLQYPVFDSEDSLYIYFTSGSTGTPKGIVGKNSSLLQFIGWEINEFNITSEDRFSQFISPYFDAFLRDIFVPLFAGATICVFQNEELAIWIDSCRVTVIHCVPTLFRAINFDTSLDNRFAYLRYILLSGEKINPIELVRWYSKFADRIQLVNLYGTTETTMIRSFYRIVPADVHRPRLPIGSPISDTELLIANAEMKPCPKLVTGDLYIVSEFITKGYINSPELTAAKFIKLNVGGANEKRAFKTGDKARVLPSGEIELLGREDRQVKLNGIRIELDEIESVLAKTGLLKNILVIVHVDSNKSESLIAFVERNKNPKVERNSEIELLGYLKEKLPSYMVPDKIVDVNSFPLLSNGKINQKALVNLLNDSEAIVIPENDIERKLLAIWEEVLGKSPISTDINFNRVGGNSLQMMNLIGKINKRLGVKFTLIGLFENLTIKKQAVFVQQQALNIQDDIAPALIQDSYPLSSSQQRLYFLHELDGASKAYHMPQAVIIVGALDSNRIERTINLLVQRHEILRTYFAVVSGEPRQKVVEAIEVKIEIIFEEKNNLKATIKSLMRPFDLGQTPLLRVTLIKLSGDEHVLFFDTHHIIVDGRSQSIIVKDFKALYSNEKLPTLKLQYKDYAVWQQSEQHQKAIAMQKEFWLREYASEFKPIVLPKDSQQHGARISSESAILLTLLNDETNKLRLIADEQDATMFMAVFAIYNILLAKMISSEDIIIGVSLAGRHGEHLEHVVGMFVNTLPFRNFPKNELTFREFLSELKVSTLRYLQNQDYPYDELIAALNVGKDHGRDQLFNTIFSYQNYEQAEFELPDVSMKAYEWEDSDAKFDMSLFVTETESTLNLQFKYATQFFKTERIQKLVYAFNQVVVQVTANQDIRIADIDITFSDRQMLKKQLEQKSSKIEVVI